MTEITDKIIEITGSEPGPTLAIFAGVHGNETAGVFALQEMLPTLTIPNGKLLIAFANPPAIADNVRMHAKNLNRCFFKDNNGTDYEDERARQLMEVLDKSDALLDLHMFYDPDGVPFAICEDDSLEVATKFDVDIISTDWVDVEPGATDWYMHKNGKVGICIECGPISKAREYKDFAVKTVQQFLKYYGMGFEDVDYSAKPKRIIKAQKAIHKTSDNFVLTPGLHNFDKLTEGQIIAKDDETTYIAKDGQCIIFPHYKARIDEEAYIIGIEKS